METRTDNEKALIDKFMFGHVKPPWRKNEAQYHNSWDLLMPVVEKIQQTGPRSTSFLSGLSAPREHVFTIHESYTGEHKLIQCANDSAIKAVYGAVVGFHSRCF